MIDPNPWISTTAQSSPIQPTAIPSLLSHAPGFQLRAVSEVSPREGVPPLKRRKSCTGTIVTKAVRTLFTATTASATVSRPPSPLSGSATTASGSTRQASPEPRDVMLGEQDRESPTQLLISLPEDMVTDPTYITDPGVVPSDPRDTTINISTYATPSISTLEDPTEIKPDDETTQTITLIESEHDNTGVDDTTGDKP